MIDIKSQSTAWRKVKLGEVVDIIDGDRGVNYPNGPDFSDSGYCLFLNAKNVIGSDFDFSECQFITKKKHEKLRSGRLQRGDFILTTRGTIGNIAYYGDSILHEHMRINSGMVILRPRENIIENKFFYLFLISQKFKEQIVALQSGSAQPQLPIRDLKLFEISLPSIEEQKYVMSILWPINDKIELNNKISAALEQMAQAIFKEWFIKFKVKSEKLKVKNGIPKGWEVKKLPEVFDFLEGPGIRNWQYAPKGCPFINIRLIQNNDIDIKSASFISEKEANGKYKHFHLKERDMVVSTSGTLGRSAIVRKEHLPLLLNTSVIRFRPKDNRSYDFMYQFLNSTYFQNKILSMASGSAQPNFGPIHLKQIEVLVPDQKVLEMFDEAVNPVYEKIIANMSENQKLAALRDLLLPKLMSGEV